MRTARDLITDAAKTAGVIDAIESLDSLEASHALSELNSIIETFNLDPLFVPKNTQQTVTSTITTGIITLGETAPVDVNTVRPNRIIAVAIEENGEYVPLDYISENDFVLKAKSTTNTGSPKFYTTHSDFPNFSIELYPKVTPSNTVITYQYVQTAYGLNDEITLPDGYYPALQYELAATLALIYGNVEMVPMLEKKAMEKMTRIKRLNNKTRTMKIRGSVGMGGSYNIYTDGN